MFLSGYHFRMRHYVTIIFFLLGTVHSYAVHFSTLSISESLQKAKKENKKVLVFYSAEWCLPCNTMKNSVFKDQVIETLIHNSVIPVIVDFKAASSSEWINAYDVRILPTNIMLDADGQVVNRYEGGMEIDRYKAFLKNEKWEEHTNIPIYTTHDHNTKIIAVNSGPSTPQSVFVEPKITENLIEHHADIHDHSVVESEDSYVIQFAAFLSMEKLLKYQSYIRNIFVEETVIITESDSAKMLHKLITRNRYSRHQAYKISKKLDSQGLESFPKMIR